MSRTMKQRSLSSHSLLGLVAALALPLPACSTSNASDEALDNRGNVADKAGFDEVVYVVRQTLDAKGQPDVAGGAGQVMNYGRYEPGGRIEVRNLRTGEVKNLIEQYKTADVEGLDLNFEATKVVFAMKTDANANYHLYTATLTRGDDDKNPYGVTELTDGSYDDLTPIWVADGKIAFVTNEKYAALGLRRSDEYNHADGVTQIATITETGGDSDRRLCSQNLSHVFNPFRMQSGQIGYSRWEHLENINDSKLFAMNPDCTQMIALAGEHNNKRANSLVQVTESNDRNVFIGIGTDRERTIKAGALMQIDARSSNDDTRHDEERVKFTVLTPSVPLDSAPSAIGRYRDPRMLPDGRLLVSWADGVVSDVNELSETPPDFGIYIYDPTTRTNQLVYNGQGTWELYAEPVAPEAVPPSLDSVNTSQDGTKPLTIGSINITNTSLYTLHQDTVGGAEFPDKTPTDEALKKAVKVRIIEGFSSESAPDVTMFGLTMAEGAAILGEAPVLADGSWRAEVPPFIPMHLQAVDEFELAIRSQTTWIQGMPNEVRVCGGCHEERTAPNRPGLQQQPFATNQPQHFMTPVAQRTEYPWELRGHTAGANSLEVQSILNAKCIQCHNGTTNGDVAQEHYTVTAMDRETGKTSTVQIPRLDLTSTPITVTYDRKTATYPMSYVSIFYPSAMEMVPSAKVTGTVPPKWGVPSDARNSALIEKINIKSAFDPNRTAWTLGQPFSDPAIRGGTRKMHPDDVGVALTREERTALIRAFDMGGQYFSRQNTGITGGTTTTTTPVYPTTN